MQVTKTEHRIGKGLSRQENLCRLLLNIENYPGRSKAELIQLSQSGTRPVRRYLNKALEESFIIHEYDAVQRRTIFFITKEGKNYLKTIERERMRLR